jgi:hypothetical protein
MSALTPEDIQRIVGKLGRLWERFPHLRLEQLLQNLHGERDAFHVPDDVIEGLLDTALNYPDRPQPVWPPGEALATRRGR